MYLVAYKREGIYQFTEFNKKIQNINKKNPFILFFWKKITFLA